MVKTLVFPKRKNGASFFFQKKAGSLIKKKKLDKKASIVVQAKLEHLFSQKAENHFSFRKTVPHFATQNEGSQKMKLVNKIPFIVLRN